MKTLHFYLYLYKDQYRYLYQDLVLLGNSAEGHRNRNESLMVKANEHCQARGSLGKPKDPFSSLSRDEENFNV